MFKVTEEEIAPDQVRLQFGWLCKRCLHETIGCRHVYSPQPFLLCCQQVYNSMQTKLLLSTKCNTQRAGWVLLLTSYSINSSTLWQATKHSSSLKSKNFIKFRTLCRLIEAAGLIKKILKQSYKLFLRKKKQKIAWLSREISSMMWKKLDESSVKANLEVVHFNFKSLVPARRMPNLVWKVNIIWDVSSFVRKVWNLMQKWYVLVAH